MEKNLKKNKVSKDVLNIIRTTMRNNIELTHIADNKANVLLSLNALMLTFSSSIVIPFIDVIKQNNLGFPLALFVVTGLLTIYMCTLVLKPSRFYEKREDIKKGKLRSPFFFGNFYKMEKSEYWDYINKALSDQSDLREYLVEDLHYIGSRLGHKMLIIRYAFRIFLIGFFTSISLTLILMFVYN